MISANFEISFEKIHERNGKCTPTPISAYLKSMHLHRVLNPSSRGGLGVERWSDNLLHSAPLDQSPLGETIPAMSMFYVYMIPTPTDVCYKCIETIKTQIINNL